MTSFPSKDSNQSKDGFLDVKPDVSELFPQRCEGDVEMKDTEDDSHLSHLYSPNPVDGENNLCTPSKNFLSPHKFLEFPPTPQAPLNGATPQTPASNNSGNSSPGNRLSQFFAANSPSGSPPKCNLPSTPSGNGQNNKNEGSFNEQSPDNNSLLSVPIEQPNSRKRKRENDLFSDQDDNTLSNASDGDDMQIGNLLETPISKRRF